LKSGRIRQHAVQDMNLVVGCSSDPKNEQNKVGVHK